MEQGPVFFLGVRFLLSGWVTMEVWNVVGQRARWGGARGGQRQGAGTLVKGPEAQGHQQFSPNRAWGGTQSEAYNNTSAGSPHPAPSPLLLNGPGEGRQSWENKRN